MKWKCCFCFEWSDIEPCEHCGTPKPPEPAKTEEELRDEVLDRLRGGPRTRMKVLAAYCEMDYDTLMGRLSDYVNGFDDYISLGVDTPYDDVDQMWADYELITKTVVPADKKDSPFSCSC